ncbi:RinA family phage transcriptional activator [Weissella uvarum]|uniref:DUF722 domain-containing protein n=1 Tax=Weissella uvarum TaxID=1479233 RepID=UPI001961DFDE|nr:DUF722 domain-containing protein [Weissella uvarum]MBM7617314.1 RinA family phage transcriptional activator [Weissella uvarum]MCM0595181.1 DUF722 domain-containing protein [Weissella uvarum]
MADQYDKVLTQYFTGGLDIAIKEREQELRLIKSARDDNFGGGKAQNKYFNVVENTMDKLENDRYLAEMKRQRDIIRGCVEQFDREHQEVFYQWYRNRMGWELIAQLHHADRSTVLRWRDKLKKACREAHLLSNEAGRS